MRCKDEQEILTLISCGNPDGLKSLFDLYYKPLCIFAMNFLDSFGESEDIVQDLFVKFWEKYKDKQFEGSLRAYFFTAVRHNCAKVLKLKNRYNLQLEEEYIDEPVYSEVARLPEQCRKVFELIVLKDMKYKEVADFLGLSVNTVKTHFARALKQLRSSLQILLVFLLRK